MTRGSALSVGDEYPDPNVPQPHAASSYGDDAYTYDANGNMTQRVQGGITYTQTFDAENRLVTVSGNGTTTTYAYDGDGNRVKRIVDDGSTVTTTIYVAGMEIEKVSASETKRTIYYALGGAFRVIGGSNEGVYFRHGDHLGSTSLITDSTGNAVSGSDIRYAPFGEMRASSTLPTLTDFGYTGQILDKPTGGLMFYQARYYLPELRRFISADAIVPQPLNSQAYNRYSLAYNNPIKYVDPTGHAPCLVSQDCFNTLGDFENMTVQERIEWMEDFMATVPDADDWFNNIVDVLEYFAISQIFTDLDGSTPISEWMSSADAGVIEVIQNGYMIHAGLATLTPGGFYSQQHAHLNHQLRNSKEGLAISNWDNFFDNLAARKSHDEMITYWARAEQPGVNYGRAYAYTQVALGADDQIVETAFWALTSTYREIGKIQDGGDTAGGIVGNAIGGLIGGTLGAGIGQQVGEQFGDWFVDPTSTTSLSYLGPTGSAALLFETLILKYTPYTP